MFQTPIHEADQVPTEKGEKKVSTFGIDKLKKGYEVAVKLENDINTWAGEKSLQQPQRRKEKFSSLICLLDKRMPHFREELMEKKKNTYDLVRMGKDDLISEEEKKRLDEIREAQFNVNRTDYQPPVLFTYRQ